ncbi:MAG: PrsW family intramembrane metalloprotease [Patescibacteria group bacterium]|nr:PrsW family intramembrane metalloprotease [Patescibacteria group bacterium]MBU1877141.1 PrsW family intramembrane metalloprotease [Patescibacteria group bacterium]
MNYPLYIFLGMAPSILWLLFYLKRDKHPEPKLMILRIFLWGMASALPAIFIEKGLALEITKFNLPLSWIPIVNILLGAALVEETIKYLVVRGQIMKHKEFDEPVDAMIYMIVAALGFAASENVLIVFGVASSLVLEKTLLIVLLRSLGAISLHALCSAVVGFWLAVSFSRYRQEKFRLVLRGMIIAICLHGLFNFFIMKGGTIGFLIPIFIIMVLGLFVSFCLKNLKENYF